VKAVAVPTANDVERAVLVGTRLPDAAPSAEDPLDELAALVQSAGGEVVARVLQKRPRVDPRTYIGRGKVEEVAMLATAAGAAFVAFDNNLSPAQARNLEQSLGVRVVDRTELILDIFARRARTRLAKIQVELAQLTYMAPRLRRMWTHLPRQSRAIGARGPGETQLETDRRLLGKRLRDLRRQLERIETRRVREVRSRAETFQVALVGYTNAGKSTLQRALTGASARVSSEVFSTLDTRTRSWRVPGVRGEVVLSDTVGFVRDLPDDLVSSFHATLEEAIHADLLLHVVNASSSEAPAHVEVVREVLAEIGADRLPQWLVLNQIDRVADRMEVERLRRLTEGAPSFEVSALRGTGLDRLAEAVREAIDAQRVEVVLVARAGAGSLLAHLEATGEILERAFDETSMRLRVRLDRRAAGGLRDRYGDDLLRFETVDGRPVRES